MIDWPHVRRFITLLLVLFGVLLAVATAVWFLGSSGILYVMALAGLSMLARGIWLFARGIWDITA